MQRVKKLSPAIDGRSWKVTYRIGKEIITAILTLILHSSLSQALGKHVNKQKSLGRYKIKYNWVVLRRYFSQTSKELDELYMLQIQNEPKYQVVSFPLLPHPHLYASKGPFADHLSEWIFLQMPSSMHCFSLVSLLW